jgi:hypothetical protein
LWGGAPPSKAQSAEPGRRLALLIGVNEYDAVPDLRGALNDVELLKSVLTTKGGFAERDVELLLDRAATRRGILAAIDRLAKRARPADVVYVHYSGHGSQVKDVNGDEQDDGFDETLVPSDGRTPGVTDITDDELAEHLARVEASSVAIVLDACHSGTGTRQVLQRRSVPGDERDELYVRTATRAVVPVAGKRHVLMSGAASNEEALDGPVDGRSHGLFSYALARSVGKLGSEASPRELFAAAGSELERIKAQLGLHRLPEPQLEGEDRRLNAPWLALASSTGASSPEPTPPRLPWAPALRRGPGNLLLRGGVALGATPGSLWAVYGRAERAFAPGAALAEAEVIEIAGADAVARFAPAEAAIPPGARAVLSAPPLPDEAVPVRIATSDASRAARLQGLLRERVPSLRFAAEGDFARFRLELAGDRWRLLGADGQSEVVPLASGSDAEVAEAIAAQLRRSMSAAELLALDNPASGFQLRLGLVAPPATSFRVRLPGEPRLPENSLQLRVSSSRACHLTVVDVDAAGLVQTIFPNAISEQRGYRPGGLLEANEPLDIPDSLSSPNQAGFFIDYAPPTGIDTVRAFCTSERRAAIALREAIGRITASRDASRAAVRGALLAARSALGRGVRIVAEGAEETLPEDELLPASGDWAAASLTVRVGD